MVELNDEDLIFQKGDQVGFKKLDGKDSSSDNEEIIDGLGKVGADVAMEVEVNKCTICSEPILEQ